MGMNKKQCSNNADKMAEPLSYDMSFSRESIVNYKNGRSPGLLFRHLPIYNLYKVVYRRKRMSFTVARQPVIFTRFPIKSSLK